MITTEAENLIEIQTDIEKCSECSFDPKTCARYCGGHGSDHRVMFIAESPSTSGGIGIFQPKANFSSTQADELFYLAKKSAGLENCYVTDFVKCGVANGKPSLETFQKCSTFLKREISIVRPKVIVITMKNVAVMNADKKIDYFDSVLFANDLLGKFFKEEFGKMLPVLWTWHYSYVWNRCRLKMNLIESDDSFPIRPDRWETYLSQHQRILDYL